MINYLVTILIDARQLKHKHIISLIGVTVDSTTNETMLMMDYMQNGSLEALLLHEKPHLSKEDVIVLALDIAEGLQYLHSCKIIHRDLKSANVLVRFQPYLKCI